MHASHCLHQAPYLSPSFSHQASATATLCYWRSKASSSYAIELHVNIVLPWQVQALHMVQRFTRRWQLQDVHIAHLCVDEQEVQGLVWVWPSIGPQAAAEAAATAPCIPPSQLQAGEERLLMERPWFRRDLPYSFDLLIENLADQVLLGALPVP